MEQQEFRLKYRPRKFSDFIGNEEPIRILKNAIRKGPRPKGILLHGPAGTGKTSLAEVYVKGLFCKHFTDDLCGTCELCLENKDYLFGNVLGFSIHDCTQLDRATLKKQIFSSFRWTFSSLNGNIHLFDEFHRAQQPIQDMFLRVMELQEDMSLIFCLIDIDKITEEFLARCQVLETKKPEVKELTPWLERICQSEGISIEGSNVLEQVAVSCDCVPRKCLGFLERVLLMDEPLSTKLIARMNQTGVKQKSGYKVV